MKETLLQLKNATVRYGGVTALDDVSIALDEGEIVALMGPNGAGKTTIIKALFGIAPLAHGGVYFHEEQVSPVLHQMVQRGVSYVPQGRQVFKHLTVLENLELGGYVLSNKSDVGKNIEELLKIFPDLKTKLHERAGALSGGQQQMLTIARGLVSDPKVLLLDEPSLGLSPKVVKEIFALIKEINQLRKIAILVVEHSIASVLGIADRAYVLAHGKVVADASAKELSSSDTLQKVFLSSMHDAA